MLLSAEKIYLSPSIYVDCDRQDLVKDKLRLSLSRVQYRLLYRLLVELGHPVPNKVLINFVWGEELCSLNGLYICVHRIRKMIEADVRHPKHLIPVKGLGYMLCSTYPGRSFSSASG
ncbi:winged helix-turn-helix domain-containing protein [Alicyclobacillus acidiphilus]